MPKPIKYRRVSEIFANGRPSSIAKDVQEELRKERESRVLDPDLIRQREDWSFLAHQIVGGEHRRSE